MPRVNEHPDRPHAPPAAPLWRPAGAVFLAVSLGALAAGAMPGLFLPPHRAAALSPAPALPLLCAAQAAFLLVVCPLLLRARGNRSLASYLLATVGEYVLWLAASVPLYVVAAWVSDATARDVVRAGLYLSGVAAAAWGLGLWVRTRRAGLVTAATLAAALIALAAPAAVYLLAELRGWPSGVDRLLSAAPATCAFRLAHRADNWLPAPLWAWALWPAAGLAAALARLLVKPARPSRP